MADVRPELSNDDPMPHDRISEFTFGYAYTQELAKLWAAHVLAPPVFPNQYAEGKSGGGYDMALESTNGFIYFAQFKLSQEITSHWSSNQREFGEPFRRFLIYGSKTSKQHELLLKLEQPGTFVEYVAPDFGTYGELSAKYVVGGVRTGSTRVRPSIIGSFDDESDHHVVWSAGQARVAVFSEPRFLDGPINAGEITESGIEAYDEANLDVDVDAPVDQALTPPSLLQRLETAQQLLFQFSRASDQLFETEPDLMSRVRTLARLVLGAEMFVVLPPDSLAGAGKDTI